MTVPRIVLAVCVRSTYQCPYDDRQRTTSLCVHKAMCRRPYLSSAKSSSFHLPVYVNPLEESSKPKAFPLSTTLFLPLVLLFSIVLSWKMSTVGMQNELLRPIVFCGPSGAGKGMLRYYAAFFLLERKKKVFSTLV